MAHELSPEGLLGLVHVMGPASQSDLSFRRPASQRHRPYMVIFHEPALPTAPAVRADVCALTPISLPDGALHVVRDVARIGAHPRRALSGLPGRSEFLFLELGDQSVECPIEDFGDIAGWNPMTEQRLNILELFERALAHGELNSEALRREW